MLFPFTTSVRNGFVLVLPLVEAPLAPSELLKGFDRPMVLYLNGFVAESLLSSKTRCGQLLNFIPWTFDLRIEFSVKWHIHTTGLFWTFKKKPSKLIQ